MCPTQPFAGLWFSVAPYFPSKARIVFGDSAESLRHQLIPCKASWKQGFGRWIFVRDEERKCGFFLLMHSLFALFETRRNLISSLSDYVYDKTSQGPRGKERSGQVIPSPKPWLFLSPFRARPLPTSTLHVRHVVNHAELPHVLPTHLKSPGTVKGEALFLRTAPKHRTCPSAIPSSCLVCPQLGRPWEGEVDGSSFS